MPSIRKKSPARKHKVVALAYDQLCTFEYGCAVEVFSIPRPELDVTWYDFVTCAAERGPIRAAGGLTLTVRHSLNALDRADTIIIPGWRDAHEIPSTALLKKIRAAHDRGARIASICSGVFVLAAAGLLRGKTATTHWKYVDQLSQMYPNILIKANALYVDEGNIITAAGSAAGLDMMLHLVRMDHGANIANRVAQRLVVPPHREGGQAQFVPRPLPASEEGQLAKLLDWLRTHIAAPHTVQSMAKRAAVSPRTLQRLFRDATGLPAYEWLVQERVAVAKELLEMPGSTLPQIAETAGFGSEESLRRHFRILTGTSPGAYRRQFLRIE